MSTCNTISNYNYGKIYAIIIFEVKVVQEFYNRIFIKIPIK